MSKYSNLKFFDSNSDELNLNYDISEESWSGVVYIPEVSVGLYETVTIYMLEEAKGTFGETVYIKPITPLSSGNNDTILINFDGGYDTSVKSDGVNNDISIYTTSTVVNDANIPELYIKHEESTTRTRNPHSMVEVPAVSPIIFDGVVTSISDPLSTQILALKEPIQINISLNSTIESYHKRTLKIYEVDSAGKITHTIASIRIYGETVAEDERLEVLLSNIGMSLSPSDHFVFEDANLRESSPDWKLINRKRRELLLEAANIKPFIGTYKALLNAIKYFGYENITLKEYYLNINEQAENFGKLKAVAVPNQETKGFLAAKGMSTGVGPNSNLKKTSRFSLVYRLNNTTGEYDEWDIPKVKEALDFSPDEVLIKLYGLKNRLQKSYIPMHAKIVDIVGEGDYFSQFNINTWNNQQNIHSLNEGVQVGYELFPDRGLFLEDLRKVSPLFTGLGQDFVSLINQYGTTAGPVSFWNMQDINTAPNLVDRIGNNDATMMNFATGMDTVFAVDQPATSTILYVENANTWTNTHQLVYNDIVNDNVVGRHTPKGAHPKLPPFVITDYTPQLTFSTTLNNTTAFGFNDSTCVLTSVTGLRPAGEITLAGGVTIRYTGITGNTITGCVPSITSGSIPDGTSTTNQKGFWEIAGVVSIPNAVAKGDIVSNSSFSPDTPPQTTSTRSLSFSGLNKTHVVVPHDYSIKPTGSITFAVWVKHDDWFNTNAAGFNPGNQYQHILSCNKGIGGGGGYLMRWANGYLTVGLKIVGIAQAIVLKTGYNKFNGATDANPPDNPPQSAGHPSLDAHYYEAGKKDWHMISFTFDGRYARLFIDGKPADDNWVSPNLNGECVYDLGSYGHTIHYFPQYPMDVYIGGKSSWLNNGPSFLSNNYANIFDGLIDDFAIWDTALTPGRISGLYDNWNPSDISYAIGENPIYDINSFYTKYTDTDLSTFSESNIPVGCPIILKANTLLDTFNDIEELTWDDANEGMEFTYGIVTTTELALITGQEIGQLAMVNNTGPLPTDPIVLEAKKWDGSAWSPYTTVFTWDKWWHRNVYEIEWRLQGPTVNGVKYDRSFRGSIDKFYEIPVTLPYIGIYSVELSFYDLYNIRSVKFEKESIEVKSKEAETYALTQQFVPKKDWNEYDKHTWYSAGSDWNVSNENEEEVQDFTGSYYLTLDRANYANSDPDWRKSTIVRHTDGIDLGPLSNYPTTPNFKSTEGPYVWKNLKKHTWNNGETMSWDTTIIGADINPSFSFDITDNAKVKITMNYYVGTNITVATDSYEVTVAPWGAQDLSGWNLIADELNALSGVATPVTTTVATSVTVNNAATAGAPTTIISPSAAGLNTIYIADATNYIATGAIIYDDSNGTGVTTTATSMVDHTAIIAPPSAVTANGAFTTGDTAMLLTGVLTAWPTAGIAVIGGKTITYSAISSQTITVLGDTGSISTGATVSTIQGYWQVGISGGIPAATLSTQSFNGMSNGYATGGATITLSGTLTAWPTVGTITVYGKTITYGSISGQVLSVTSDTVITSAPIPNATSISSYVNAINPQLSKYTYNAVQYTTFNPNVATICNEIIAVSNGADRMHDFDTVVIDPATGVLLKSNHLIPCNPTHDNAKIINQHEIHDKLNHFTFSYDDSNVPGVVKQEWILKNNSKNIDDIYYNNRWLPYVFDETGDYTLKLKLTDVNGNEIKTTKNILTIK